ncbi:Flp family type IVb pilin [Amphiplicatus metriothermophilus]|uniref:Pilus assembly protein Flp/PilA n=1 Tax=Amphiplicatus metriothermophilus TaxID=1519374 RepID=A0A239PJP3_9PROT|nr:Flp family type IVb pilin [Amphiplicatus metriothermophilus]MBB5517886.1 pilus assembly protein Flp/PilA [Amphiplicatus metriothermophilus]SNT67780.1 pilus assembly protein Flp/PilA [Amphiplicatus metriothermophilus]
MTATGDFTALARRFAADESGATAIEYGLIVALIFLAVVAAITNYTDSTRNMYNTISNAME